MEYKYTENELTITVDSAEQCQLQLDRADDPSDFASEGYLDNVLEEMLENSEIGWIHPEECGDLTDAPMLGIHGQDDSVVSRWAFMDYQVDSVVGRLADYGKVVFVC